ncbi:hypothetical protein B7463_g9462, partial [Scytalidium lignicola]
MQAKSVENITSITTFTAEFMAFNTGRPNGPVFAASIVIIFGIIYQVVLKDILFVTVGFRRSIQPIEDFPYVCRRIHHKLLESCEDLWLDDKARNLYATCSDAVGRSGWSPGGSRYNTEARRGTDHVAVLNIDEPGIDGLYGLHQLKVSKGYKSASTDGGVELDLHGFDIQVLNNSRLRFWMINHRPPVNYALGEQLDAWKVGANSTIEVFELAMGSSELEHIHTITSKAIITPNNLIVTNDGGVLFRTLDMIFGGGSISYCGPDSQCHVAATKDFYFPNGITKGSDGLYYIAHSSKGKITVHSLQEDHTLVKIDEIKLGIPVDNLSVDAEGNIFAAAFPDSIKLMLALDAPFTTAVPSTVIRIRKAGNVHNQGGGGYEITKVLEDKHGKFLPSTTTAVHDVKTGRLFLGGIASPFITICDRSGYTSSDESTYLTQL